MTFTANNIKHLRAIKSINQVVLGEGTGIAQPRISRIESGVKLDYHEAVAIGNYFGVTAEMLLNEDLRLRFPTIQQLEVWLQQQEAAQKVAQKHLSAVAAAPMMVRALQRHYVKTISEMTGKVPDEIYQEIETIFEDLKQEYQSSLHGTSPGQDPPEQGT